MTIQVHRDRDARVCGAQTIVVGNTNVFCNSRLVSVDQDPNSHGAGNLNARNNSVYVNSKLVVNHTPEPAAPDNLCFIVGGSHCNPLTAEGSPNVFVGDR